MQGELDPLIEASRRLEIIKEHELGQTLLTRPRYGHFRPPDVSIEAWLDLFDADVNNFYHNNLTAGIASIVCELDEIEPDVRRAVVMTASIHDLPEDVTGTKDGDTQYNASSDKEQQLEHMRLRTLARLPGFPLTEFEVDQTIEIMEDSKIKPEDGGPKTLEGRLFNMVERIGYLRTALIAWQHYQSQEIPHDHKRYFLWMVGNIVGNHLATLMQYAQESKAAQLQLETSSKEIADMVSALRHMSALAAISEVCADTLKSKPKGPKPEEELERIHVAVEAWRQAA